MNDEIKEILDEEVPILQLSYGNYVSLNKYLRLKDYITNLQQENEYLKKQNDEKTKIGLADHKYASQMEDKVILLQQENERLKEDKRKASEIIKKEKENMGYAKYDSCLLLIENILQNGSEDK